MARAGLYSEVRLTMSRETIIRPAWSRPGPPPSLLDDLFFRVFHDGEMIVVYDSSHFPTIHDVIADIAQRLHHDWPDGFDGEDVSIWRGGRVLAVIQAAFDTPSRDVCVSVVKGPPQSNGPVGGDHQA